MDDIDENMTTTRTKAATIGVLAVALAITLAYSALALPASAQAQTSNSTTSNSSSSGTATSTTTAPPGRLGGPGWGPFGAGPLRGGHGLGQQPANLTVGQTITITSSSGNYVVVGNHDQNGTASGTLTFTVTGKLAGGYTLSITSGSLVVSGTTYTVSSGSAQMGRDAARLVGQGATSSSGEFLVTASAHGSFVGTTATMSLDLSNGSTEYLVFLSGTA